VPHRQGIARPPLGGLRSTTAGVAAAPPAFDLMRLRNGAIGGTEQPSITLGAERRAIPHRL